MGVGGTEDQRFLPRGRIEFLGEDVANNAVERFGDDFTVKVFDVDPDLVGSGEKLDLVAACMVNLDLLACPPDDPVGRKFSIDLNRRLVVNEITVNYRFSVTVGVDRWAKNLSCV